MKTELKPILSEIDAWINEHMEDFCEDSLLKESASYALSSGGKRLRPLIVYLVADALGNGFDISAPAKSVEFFHTASLIADDLPCMDNDEFRRGNKSVHARFGQATALLSSYGLIVEAFAMIEKSAEVFAASSKENAMKKGDVISIALQEASRLAGFHGCVLGQFYDLEAPPTEETGLSRLLYLKTGTLFEVSFIFGWIFGGGDLKKIEKVKRLSKHFGALCQIRDDILDRKQDENKAPNSANILGLDGALKKYNEEMEIFTKHLKELSLDSLPFQKLLTKLSLEMAG